MPSCPGDVGGHGEQVAEERAVGLGEVERGGDVLPRHEEDVRRRARGDVVDGDEQVVLVDASRGDLPGDDAAEEAVAVRHGRPPFGARWRGPSSRYQSAGFVLMRKPMTPTAVAMT